MHAANERMAAQATNQPPGGVVNLPPPARPDDQTKAREKLENLRLELSRLLAHSTHQHPQVIVVQAQISALEGTLGIKARSDSSTNSSGPELIPAPAGDHARATRNVARPVSHFVSMPIPTAAGNNAGIDFVAQINKYIAGIKGPSVAPPPWNQGNQVEREPEYNKRCGGAPE